MQKNFIFISIAVVFLSILFIVVSLLVLFTRGNRPSFISKKLLIGGLILTLTAMTSSCSNGGQVVNCYVGPPDTGDSGDTGDTGDNGNIGNEGNANNNDEGDSGIVVVCYYIAPINDEISINNIFSNGAIQLNLNETNIISGSISNRKSSEFSFRLATKKDEKPLQIGNINADDGSFDETKEEYSIEIDKSTPKGEYIIYFYNVNVKNQETNLKQYLRSYYININ